MIADSTKRQLVFRGGRPFRTLGDGFQDSV